MRVNWTNALTIVSATVLIGTQTVGLGFATGWAAAGLLGIGDYGAWLLEGLLSAAGLAATAAFAIAANRNEPMIDR
jgi:hypothetical protein